MGRVYRQLEGLREVKCGFTRGFAPIVIALGWLMMFAGLA